MTKWHFIIVVAAISSLSACETSQGGAVPSSSIKTIGFAQDAPADAAPGSCWGKTISPAIIETVTREVLLQPAKFNADGLVLQPATYKKESRQEIVQPRKETWFETVCPNLLTEDRISNLQRALTVRGSYRGKVTGLMDDHTRRAIRKYQLGGGFDSGNLTVASALALGLVAVPRDPVE